MTARGRRPRASACSALMIRTAAAPSTICEELPAVTRPSGTKDGLRPASSASEVSRIALVGEQGVAGLTVTSPVSRSRTLTGHGDDLALEAALVAGGGGTLVALQTVGVQLLAGQLPPVDDHLRGDALRDEPAGSVRLAVGVALVRRLAVDGADVAAGRVGEHRHGGHGLQAGRDHDVAGPGHDRLRGEVDGLLGGAALPVDGRGGHGLGPARGQDGRPADVGALADRSGSRSP